MRLLLKLMLVVAIGFCAYWALAAQIIPRQGTQVLARTAGLEGTAGPVSGFPFAFQTRIEDAAWQDTHGQFRWQSAHLDVEAASYQPNRLRLAFPAPQMLDLAGQDLRLETAHQIIDATLNRDLSLAEGQITIRDMQITPPVTLTGFGALEGSLVQTEPMRFQADLEITDLALADILRLQIDPSQSRPDRIDRITLEAALTFAAPEGAPEMPPVLSHLDLTGLHMTWSDLWLTLSGVLTRAPTGLFDGELSLHSPAWRDLHQALGDAGFLDSDAMMLAGMLLASQADPDTGAITLPLSVRQSTVALGPFVFGTLPGL